MAQTVSVGLHAKVTPIISGWTVSTGNGSRKLSSSVAAALHPQAAPVGSGNGSSGSTVGAAFVAHASLSGNGSTAPRCKSPVSSSIYSSSVCSPPSESKWTSFDESEEEEAFSERISSSDQHGLLPITDDAASDGDDGLDESLVITPTLHEYYSACFNELLEKTQGSADPQSAVRGQDPGVFEFFLKSKLPRDELGKVWKLADVNEDGYLNFEEFCVAMHLIVRRVKGNFPIPDYLPHALMPTKTPPRNVTPCPHDWTHFEAPPDRKSSSLPRMRVNATAAGTESPLKDFTDSLALTVDRSKSLICPVACRVSPSHGEDACGAETEAACSKTTPNKAILCRPLVISPQAPKGPPPKPPPRPVVRHGRSASLDLTKNGAKKNFNVPPPSAPAPQLPRTTVRMGSSNSDSCEASVQTDSTVRMPAAVPGGESTSTSSASSVVKVVEPKLAESKANSVEDKLGSDKCDGRVVVTLPTANSAAAVQKAICQPREVRAAATAVLELKDWKKRCEDTSRLNALLERELKQLMELRIGLESDLNQLRKQNNNPAS